MESAQNTCAGRRVASVSRSAIGSVYCLAQLAYLVSLSHLDVTCHLHSLLKLEREAIYAELAQFVSACAFLRKFSGRPEASARCRYRFPSSAFPALIKAAPKWY